MADYDALITEIREDYQLPPYVSDTVITRYIQEGEAFFNSLAISVDYDSDLELRSLLKNYVYYAWNHVLNEFQENYSRSILKWQFEHEEDPSDLESDEYATMSTLKYIANGGSGTMYSVSVTIGETMEVDECGFTYSGYSFKEWNTSSDGSGDSYAPGDDITLDSKNVNLYAIWEEES